MKRASGTFVFASNATGKGNDPPNVAGSVQRVKGVKKGAVSWETWPCRPARKTEGIEKTFSKGEVAVHISRPSHL